MQPDRETLFLGADLGGTNCRVGVRAAGSVELRALVSFPSSSEWEAEDIAAVIRDTLPNLGTRALAAIGLGLTGDPDPFTGVCHSMTRFPRLEGVNLPKALERVLGARVRVVNDGLAAAFGELRAGAGRGVDRFVMVTLGTGVGGGVVLDGRLVLGPGGRFGKIGHQILDVDGPSHCHCGLPGCWQSLVGIAGVQARAWALAQDRPGSPLAALGRRAELHALVALAERGDPEAQSVMSRTGCLVGIGLANLVKTLAPDLAIVGGGIAEGSQVLLEAAQQVVNDYAVLAYQRIPVVAARLGRHAGVVGATFLAEEGINAG